MLSMAGFSCIVEGHPIAMNKTRLLLLALAIALCTQFLAAATPATREEVVKQVNSCEGILREFMASPATAIPPKVLGAARAIIITNQFKVGFVFGIQGGYGVILVKKPNGRWSLPAVIRAGEASLGLQLGGKSVETIYVITNDQTPRLLLDGRIDFGADAKAVAGPKAAEAESWQDGTMLQIPVLVYAKNTGFYAGATVKAGFVSRDDDSNHLLYHTDYDLPELLYGDFVAPVPEVQFLMRYMQRIAP
jgi:lipid-binding SYLF domain-containing protein